MSSKYAQEQAGVSQLRSDQCVIASESLIDEIKAGDAQIDGLEPHPVTLTLTQVDGTRMDDLNEVSEVAHDAYHIRNGGLPVKVTQS